MKIIHVLINTLIIVLLFTNSAWTQDKIILKNGSVLDCRIIEYKPEGVMIDITGGNIGNILVNKTDIAQIIVPPPSEIKKAEQYFSAKKYNQAIAQYKEVLDKYRNYSYSWKGNVYLALARCYIEEKRLSEAQDTFNIILREFDVIRLIQKACLGLAEVIFLERDFSKAKKAYTDIIKKYPKEKETLAAAYYYLGECSVGLKEYEEALISFLKVVIFYYDYPEWVVKAKFRSGEMAEFLQDWKRAKWTYEELIEEAPDSPYAQRAREKLSLLKKE